MFDLTKGEIRRIKCSAGLTKVPAGKRWLVMTGNIRHVTGTQTNVYLVDGTNAVVNRCFKAYIASASGSADYSLFNLQASSIQVSHPSFLLISSGWGIVVEGGTGVYVNLCVWEIDEYGRT